MKKRVRRPSNYINTVNDESEVVLQTDFMPYPLSISSSPEPMKEISPYVPISTFQSRAEDVGQNRETISETSKGFVVPEGTFNIVGTTATLMELRKSPYHSCGDERHLGRSNEPFSLKSCI